MDSAVAEDLVIAVAAASVTGDENRKILQFNRQVVPIIRRRGAWASEVAEAILPAGATPHVVAVDTGAAITTVPGHTAAEWADVAVAATGEAVQVATEVLPAITVVITMDLRHRTVEWAVDTNTAGTILDLRHGNSSTHDNLRTQPQ